MRFARDGRFTQKQPAAFISALASIAAIDFEHPKKSFHAEETGCGSDNHSSSDQPMVLSRDHQSYQLQRFDQQQT
jgi:hypothetical protein